MSKKFYIAGAVVVAALLVGGIFVFMQGATNTPSAPPPAPGPISNPPTPPAPAPMTPPTPTSVTPTPNPITSPVPPPAPTPAPKNPAVITYTDSGFSPGTLTVKAGAKVTFENKSSEPFWPASNPHPVHTGYPTTGGCTGSTFDACKGLQPGDSWSFTFNVVGQWGYHDHLNPGQRGTVIVN